MKEKERRERERKISLFHPIQSQIVQRDDNYKVVIIILKIIDCGWNDDTSNDSAGSGLTIHTSIFIIQFEWKWKEAFIIYVTQLRVRQSKTFGDN
jgi:hypothetical protein